MVNLFIYFVLPIGKWLHATYVFVFECLETIFNNKYEISTNVNNINFWRDRKRDGKGLQIVGGENWSKLDIWAKTETIKKS